MLKRRYGVKSLSPDILKGSDGVLYHALKNYFDVGVRPVIFQQRGDYERTMDDIEVHSVIDVVYTASQSPDYSSDDEKKQARTSKHVPEKVKKNADVRAENTEEEERTKSVEGKANVCFIRGISTDSFIKLVEEEGREYTGNESEDAEYAYLHAALFVYPKKTQSKKKIVVIGKQTYEKK